MSAPQFTPGPWALNRMDSAEEFADLRGVTLLPHEGFYRANSGAWIVTRLGIDDEGYRVGGPVCEVTFKGTAKRGEAYKAPDPEGQANAHLISSAPELYEACAEALAFVEEMEGKFDKHFLVGGKLADALAKARGQ